jgi:hypothetical protein
MLCVRTGAGASKALITTFFTGTQLLILKALPKGRQFNQEDILEHVRSSFSRQKRSNRRKKASVDFVVHMDDSMCHNARKD